MPQKIINAVVNGKNISLDKQIFLKDYIKQNKISGKFLVVEYNGRLIDAKKFDKIKIKNNDRIEIVNFVGGG